MIDLMTMQGILWDDDLGKDPKVVPVPADMQAAAELARHAMVERSLSSMTSSRCAIWKAARSALMS